MDEDALSLACSTVARSRNIASGMERMISLPFSCVALPVQAMPQSLSTGDFP
jgi:hypothetical protein